MLGATLGFDLGTSTILIYMVGKGIVLREPSVIAFNSETGMVECAGFEACKMLGRTPSSIIALRPLEKGVVANYRLTEQMIKYFLDKVCDKKFFKPQVIISIPNSVTFVERRAVIEAAKNAGARKVYVIDESLAAAIGAGINISAAHGNLIIDIGGGTTDIAVITLNGVAASTSIKVAGDTFDEVIKRYVRTKYNILIGERTAELIKKEIGSIVPQEYELKAVAKGRNLITGLPQSVELASSELTPLLAETADLIVDALMEVLEDTTPELICDLYSDGLTLTGGGALIKGISEYLNQKTNISVNIPDDPIACVAVGTAKAIEYEDILSQE